MHKIDRGSINQGLGVFGQGAGSIDCRLNPLRISPSPPQSGNNEPFARAARRRRVLVALYY